MPKAAATSGASRTIELPEAVDVSSCLEMFRRFGDDHLDRFDGVRALRTAPSGTVPIVYRYAVQPGLVRAVQIEVADVAGLDPAARAMSHSFVPAPRSFAALAASDSIIGRLARSFPGVRPVLQHDMFAAVIRSISAQQVNLRWAATTRSRLALAFGTRHMLGEEEIRVLEPVRLAEVSVAQIRELQFTTQKAASIVAVSRAFADGLIDPDELAVLPDQDVIDRLTSLRGIGMWTAEWILARVLGRPRVVAGDLGVRKAVGRVFRLDHTPMEAEVREITAHWGESAGIVQALVLHDLVTGSK